MERKRTTAKRTVYFVANNHTGDILFPRASRGAIKSVPLVLPAGKSIMVEADEWIQLKTNKSVRNYIEAGLISEVAKEGDVPVSSQSSTELPIPEHLLREEETGDNVPVKASVRRKKVSLIDMK